MNIARRYSWRFYHGCSISSNILLTLFLKSFECLSIWSCKHSFSSFLSSGYFFVRLNSTKSALDLMVTFVSGDKSHCKDRSMASASFSGGMPAMSHQLANEVLSMGLRSSQNFSKKGSSLCNLLGSCIPMSLRSQRNLMAVFSSHFNSLERIFISISLSTMVVAHNFLCSPELVASDDSSSWYNLVFEKLSLNLIT
jgi:hypothetical protein